MLGVVLGHSIVVLAEEKKRFGSANMSAAEMNALRSQGSHNGSSYDVGESRVHVYTSPSFPIWNSALTAKTP